MFSRIKKKGGKGKAHRRRRRRGSSSDSSEDEAGEATRQAKGAKRINTFGTGGGGGASRAQGGGGAEAGAADPESEGKVGLFESTRDAAPAVYGGGATAHLEIDTEHDRDNRALLEKQARVTAEAAAANAAVLAAAGVGSDTAAAPAAGAGAGAGAGAAGGEGGKKLYRGQAGYTDYTGKTAETVAKNKVTGTMGPIRAPTNVRNTSMFDYAPDICKDYKETGTCGYGDSCKFLHDRSVYKAGWQIERDWEIGQKQKQASLASKGSKAKAGGGGGGDGKAGDGDGPEELPWACHICRKEFTRPVVTRCGHYFCRKCAMERYTGGKSSCEVCGKHTNGVFTAARRIEELLAIKHAQDAGAAGAGGGSGADAGAGGASGSASAGGGGGWTTARFVGGPTATGAGPAASKPGAGGGGWSRVAIPSAAASTDASAGDKEAQ